MNFQEYCSVNSGLSISLLKDKKVDLVNEIMKYKWKEEQNQHEGIDKAVVDCNERTEEYFMKQIKELKEMNMKLETLSGTEHMKKNILQEENEKLKQEVSYLTDWNIEKLNENYVPLEDYEELKEDNEKLKKENDELLGRSDADLVLILETEINELKEDYEELKLKLTKVPKKTMNYEKMMNMEKEIEELKEENEKYKQYEQHEETILSSLNFYTEQCEELKEERKELKKSIEKKDKQIERLVNHKKNRERQLDHIRTICEEKVEDVLEECFY